jgi:hypothetical protein
VGFHVDSSLLLFENHLRRFDEPGYGIGEAIASGRIPVYDHGAIERIQQVKERNEQEPNFA